MQGVCAKLFDTSACQTPFGLGAPCWVHCWCSQHAVLRAGVFTLHFATPCPHRSWRTLPLLSRKLCAPRPIFYPKSTRSAGWLASWRAAAAPRAAAPAAAAVRTAARPRLAALQLPIAAPRACRGLAGRRLLPRPAALLAQPLQPAAAVPVAALAAAAPTAALAAAVPVGAQQHPLHPLHQHPLGLLALPPRLLHRPPSRRLQPSPSSSGALIVRQTRRLAAAARASAAECQALSRCVQAATGPPVLNGWCGS